MENKEVVKLLRSYENEMFKHMSSSGIMEQIIKENNLEPLEHVKRQWYKHTVKNHDGLVFCSTIDNYVSGHGFESFGHWRDSVSYSGKVLRLATDAEVLEAFKAEAIKRGLVKGSRLKSVYSLNGQVSVNNQYRMSSHGLFFISNICIFNGKEWSKPIERKKHVIDGVTFIEEI
jgi:hypothetical protein